MGESQKQEYLKHFQTLEKSGGLCKLRTIMLTYFYYVITVLSSISLVICSKDYTVLFCDTVRQRYRYYRIMSKRICSETDKLADC